MTPRWGQDQRGRGRPGTASEGQSSWLPVLVLNPNPFLPMPGTMQGGGRICSGASGIAAAFGEAGPVWWPPMLGPFPGPGPGGTSNDSEDDEDADMLDDDDDDEEEEEGPY